MINSIERTFDLILWNSRHLDILYLAAGILLVALSLYFSHKQEH